MTTAPQTRYQRVTLEMWPLVAAICLLAALLWSGSLRTVSPILNVIASAASRTTSTAARWPALVCSPVEPSPTGGRCDGSPGEGSPRPADRACGSRCWPAPCSGWRSVISPGAGHWRAARGSRCSPRSSRYRPTVVLMFGADVKTVLTGGMLGGVLTTTAVGVRCERRSARSSRLPAGGRGHRRHGGRGGACVHRLPAPILAARTCAPRCRPNAAAARCGEPRCPLGFLRRSLADFSEAQFFGSEWASLGLIAGAVVAYLLNPVTPAYGSGLLPQILAAHGDVPRSSAVVLWRATRGPGMPVLPDLRPGGVGRPCLCSHLRRHARIQSLARRASGGGRRPASSPRRSRHDYPAHFHPFIGNVTAMAVATALIVPPPTTPTRTLKNDRDSRHPGVERVLPSTAISLP